MPTKTPAQKKVEEKASTPKQKKETRTPSTVVKEKRTTTASKRVAVKKTSTKDTACVCRAACKPEEAFWIHHGPVVSSVAELMEALGEMTDEQYSYHTRRNGNDFAVWLRDCFGKDALASRVEGATSRAKTMQALRSPCCK